MRGALIAAAGRLSPPLRAARHQTLIGLLAVTGMRPAPRTAYAAAKAAEIHLAATAAQELAPDRIRVNAVSPGSIMFPGGSWHKRQQADPARCDHLPRHVDLDCAARI